MLKWKISTPPSPLIISDMSLISMHCYHFSLAHYAVAAKKSNLSVLKFCWREMGLSFNASIHMFYITSSTLLSHGQGCESERCVIAKPTQTNWLSVKEWFQWNSMRSAKWTFVLKSFIGGRKCQKNCLQKKKNVTKSWGNSRGCDILHPP